MGGVALPDREVHAFVRDQFARSRQIYRQKLGGDLRKLLEYRRSADYDEVFKHGQLGLAAAAANTYCDNIFRHLIAASLE
ncbi:MAG: hypothetical protein HYY13_01635 [Nitrospirae bacterium]|nr:hypothetical protein [Nitrospirota bacterium]